jgi:hypothetical protein
MEASLLGGAADRTRGQKVGGGRRNKNARNEHRAATGYWVEDEVRGELPLHAPLEPLNRAQPLTDGSSMQAGAASKMPVCKHAMSQIITSHSKY